MAIVELTKEEQKVFDKFDPEKDIKDWALEAAKRKIKWSNTIHWNGDRLTNLIHASATSNPCDRYMFLQLAGAESERNNSKESQLIFDTGTAIHEQYQYYQASRAADRIYVYEDEVSFSPDNSARAKKLSLCGSADGVSLGWPFPDRKLLWEYKTIKSTKFDQLTSPSQDYIVQVHVYMYCLDIPAAVILYINKNEPKLAAYKIPFNKKMWSLIKKRVKKMQAAYKEFEEPIGVFDSRCFSCQFLKECEPPIQSAAQNMKMWRNKRKRKPT